MFWRLYTSQMRSLGATTATIRDDKQHGRGCEYAEGDQRAGAFVLPRGDTVDDNQPRWDADKHIDEFQPNRQAGPPLAHRGAALPTKLDVEAHSDFSGLHLRPSTIAYVRLKAKSANTRSHRLV